MVERSIDWNTSATYQEMDRQDEACRREADLEAMFPVESFLPEAEHYALGEGSPELVRDFVDAHSDAAYRLLMLASGQAYKLGMVEYESRLKIVDQTLWQKHLQGWIVEHAEFLQSQRIEREL